MRNKSSFKYQGRQAGPAKVKSETKRNNSMKITISLKHAKLVGTTEIELGKDLIVGASTFSINTPDGPIQGAKEHFWLTSADMKRELREIYRIFKLEGVTIELCLEKPRDAKMPESERRIMSALCEVFRSHE